MLGVGHPAQCRVLGWAGLGWGFSGHKEQMPTWTFQEKSDCCQDGWGQACSLGARLLWNMAAFSPNTSSMGGCHFMPQLPAGTPLLTMGFWSLHHLSPLHPVDPFIHQADVWGPG